MGIAEAWRVAPGATPSCAAKGSTALIYFGYSLSAKTHITAQAPKAQRLREISAFVEVSALHSQSAMNYSG